MRAGMLAFCLGIWLFSRVPVLPPWPVVGIVCLLLCAVVALVVAFCWQPTGRCRLLVLLLLAVLLGLLWSWLHAARHQHQQLPRELEGVDFWVSGQIISLPSPNAQFQQFELQIESACFRLHPRDCPVPAQATGMTGARISLNDYAGLRLWPGERWRFRVRLNRPHGFANPGGYDYEAALFQRGIIGRGYVRDTTFNARLAPAGPGLQSVRAGLRERLYELAPDLDYPGLLSALILGDRDGVSDAQWQLLTRTGTNHLLVISGLHVGFVAMTAYALINLLVRLLPRLMSWLPAQQYAAMAAVLAALMYSALAGFSLPTQRALIMVLVLMSGHLLGRRFLPSYSLLLAATLVLALAPMSVTQAGFWLSFAAVASLLFAFTGYRRADTGPPSRLSWQLLWRKWIQPQWAVSLGLLLPLLLWTGQVSLISPLTNVLAIPLVSLLVVPLALSGALLLIWLPMLAIWPLALADLLLGWLFAGLSVAAQTGPALWQPAPPGFVTAASAMLAVLLLLSPRGLVPSRTPWLLPLCLLTPLLWPADRPRPAHGQAQLQFLDVGQGLAVVVHTRRHNLVFDTGPALGPQFDTGRAVITPYLRLRDVRTLDMLIISHWHQDHSGGADSVAEQFPIRRRLGGGSTPSQGQGKGEDQTGQPNFEQCRAGQRWQWDGVSFAILHPHPDHNGDENNSSCVLLISAGGQRALLTGDIELAAETALLRRHRDRPSGLRADVLQAAHHGSASSSSLAFLQAVQPALTVVSAGYRNRFSHPSPSVVRRLRHNGSVVCQTPRSGAVQIELGAPGGPLLSATHRQRYRRFWHNIPPDEYGKVAAVSARDERGNVCGRNRDGGRLADAADNSVLHSGDCDCH
ncbi:MAG: DNA internalization-related competence protein ComEC/Rec2 [Pseudohongiella sp.]|uniref:DNA internalization-related competence protein ComEC/Rec2 n=1 Tax=Pseudohongiella sp. TaxID=1979412 RepID=UPI0034A09D8E